MNFPSSHDQFWRYFPAVKVGGGGLDVAAVASSFVSIFFCQFYRNSVSSFAASNTGMVMTLTWGKGLSGGEGSGMKWKREFVLDSSVHSLFLSFSLMCAAGIIKFIVRAFPLQLQLSLWEYRSVVGVCK